MLGITFKPTSTGDFKKKKARPFSHHSPISDGTATRSLCRTRRSRSIRGSRSRQRMRRRSQVSANACNPSISSCITLACMHGCQGQAQADRKAKPMCPLAKGVSSPSLVSTSSCHALIQFVHMHGLMHGQKGPHRARYCLTLGDPSVKVWWKPLPRPCKERTG